MEADWEFEIAPDAPVIDAEWAGFVDLRSGPERISELQEVKQLPALEQVLCRLNAPESPLFTAKCDVWELGPVDPYELAASPETCTRALACYIDLLSADGRRWGRAEGAAEWARKLCVLLAGEAHRNCRIDLVIRQAFYAPTEIGVGITVYGAGCGSCEARAKESLSCALRAFADAVAASGRATELG